MKEIPAVTCIEPLRWLTAQATTIPVVSAKVALTARVAPAFKNCLAIMR
jgi:hypothetical protein